MASDRKTVIVTGASQGIGAGIANLFLQRGYNVVANSRRISQKSELHRSDQLALVDGDIAAPSGRCRHSAAHRNPQRLPAFALTQRSNWKLEGYRGGHGVSHRGYAGNGGGDSCGRRITRW